MPKPQQKKKIFHMKSRLSRIFNLNYERKCVSNVENGLMEHRPGNGLWENKCFVNVGKKFLTFTKHMPFRGLSSIPPYQILPIDCR